MLSRDDGKISMDVPFEDEEGKVMSGTKVDDKDIEDVEEKVKDDKDNNRKRTKRRSPYVSFDDFGTDPFIEESLEIYGRDPGLGQLEEALVRMEEGERRIQRFERMHNSPVFRGFRSAYGSLKELIGKENEDEDDIYRMLSEHQKDVFMVNYVVMSMTQSYEKNLGKIAEKLDDMYDKEAETGTGRKEIDTEYQEAEKEYAEAREELEGIDRKDDPEWFRDARKRYQRAKSKLRELDADAAINTVCDIGYKKSSIILEKQKDIFEKLLYTVKEFGAKTTVYQQTLNHMTSTCEATRNLAEAGNILSEGLKNLESIKGSILGQYKKDITSIINNASGDEIGRRALEDNNDLARMSASLTYASRMRAMDYDNQSRLLDNAYPQ